MNEFLQCLFVPLLLFGGLFVLYVFGKLISIRAQADQSNELEELFIANRMTRNNDMIGLLCVIKNMSNNTDGTFTEEKRELWNIYKEKDYEDKILSQKERTILIYGE